MNTQKEPRFKNKLLRETINSDRQSRKALEESIKNGFKNGMSGDNREGLLKDAPDCDPISTIVLSPPYEAPLVQSKLHAKLWQQGGEAAVYRCVSEAMGDTGELNLAAVAGVSFSVDYDDFSAVPPPIVETGICAPLIYDIPLTPYNRDTLATMSTVTIAPIENSDVYYVDRGNAEIEFAGVQAELYTSISYVDEQGEQIGNASSNIFLRCFDSKTSGRSEWYNPFSIQHCRLSIPAGTSTIRYYARLTGRAFVSRDIEALTNQAGADKYAVALVDFRHKQRHSQFDVYVDPVMHAWNKRPGGSVVIFPRLSICEASV